MIHRSPLPDVTIPPIPVHELVLQRVSRHPDRPALIDGPSGRTLTYGQLDDAVRRLAGGLRARQMPPGEVVGLMAPNCPEYAVVFHGVVAAGGIVTTINPTYTEREVHHQLVDAGARLVVTVSAFLPVVKAAIEGTSVAEIVVIDAADGVANLTSLFGEPVAQWPSVDIDSVAVLPYSSGTTGLAKGVMLTHRTLTANIVQTLAPAELGDDERTMAVLPFFHIYGMQVVMNMTLAAGGTVITMPRFDLEQFLQLHQTHQITRCYVAPPIVVALAKHPIVERYDLSSLRQVFSGAAPLSGELAGEAGQRLGCEVVQGYGMTELSPVSHLTPPGQYKPGSVGVTVPNSETMIVDPTTGEAVGYDIDGEVWVRGPMVMKGYLNNPEATAATIDADGWLHTGDIGHIDRDGHLYVVDRLKELIKYKGFQVAPAELEALLLTHPAIADAAVIGRADEEAGELPVGFVVLKPSTTVSEAEVLAFVANQVAHYKQLRAIHFVDAVPKSASGKILRRVLRDSDAQAD